MSDRKTIIKLYKEGEEQNAIEIKVTIEDGQFRVGIDLDNYKGTKEVLDPEHCAVVLSNALGKLN